MLISRDSLKILLAQMDRVLTSPVELLLVGGSAVLVLCPQAVATKDLDAFPTDTLENLQKALNRAQKAMDPIDLNIASAAFETYLPDDWLSRIHHSPEFSTRHIRVFTPAPEDLAVMKVYRYVAKDAEDIARLANLDCFNREVFYQRFLEVLPVAIGDRRWHAQSFCLAWNALYKDRKLDVEEILKSAI